MAVEIIGTKVTSRYLGKVTVTCPVCGEVKLIDLYHYSDPNVPSEAWVYCERCKSSYVVEAKETDPEPVRERRRYANTKD